MSINEELLGQKRYRDSFDGPDYDAIRMENQNKTILELQKEIDEHKKRERAFITHLHLKDKEIKLYQGIIKDLKSRLHDGVKSECMIDPLLLNEFTQLKNLLKDKDEKLFQKEEDLSTLQPTQNK